MNLARKAICLLLFVGGCQGQVQKEANLETTEIVFLTRNGCPRSPAVFNSLKAVLEELGMTKELTTVDLGNLATDNYLTGYGSPTILVGGVDLFGQGRPRPATPM